MHVKSLELGNFRGIEHLSLDFKIGINLIIGENGVGKSSILDALAVLLSQVHSSHTASRAKELHFSMSDVKHGATFYDTRLMVDFGDGRLVSKHNFNLDKGHSSSSRYSSKLSEVDEGEFPFLAIYYSVKRADLEIPRIPPKQPLSERASAYERALNGDRVDISSFVSLLIAQADIHSTRDKGRFVKFHQALDEAIHAVIPEFSEFRIDRITQPKKCKCSIKKGKEELLLSELSDGEKNVLGLVVDLARRLFLANPEETKPLECSATVLIDEIELHLHPQWQRTFLKKLAEIFPNCQFIVTTHSPQVVGEVSDGTLIAMSLQEGKVVHTTPEQFFGMDSSWILREHMGTASRNAAVMAKIDKVFDLIDEDELEKAKEELSKLRQLGEFPDLAEAEGLVSQIEMLRE